MSPGLAEFGQDDFASGMWRSVALNKIPRNGLYNIEEFLLDDDGALYRRGMATRLSAPQVAGAPPLRGLWDLSCVSGRRTLFAGTNYIGVLNGTTPVVTTGLDVLASPGPVAKIGDYVFIPGTDLVGYLYAGSLKASGASGSAITVTAGSPVITQAAGDWRPNIDVGMLISWSVSKRWYVVKSVDSATQLTLTTPVFSDEPAGAQSLAYVPIAVLLGPNNNSSSTLGRNAKAVAAVANKLWVAEGRRVYQSKGPDPGPGATVGVVRPLDFNRDASGAYTDYHEFPSSVVALAPIRDRLLVFTQDGMYLLSGCALDLVDAFGNAQQRIEKVSDEVVVLSASGVCVASDFVVVAARDGVYMIDSLGRPEMLSRSIETLWQGYVKGGQTPGMPTVFRNHLFVGMGTTDTTLVCRLDRPQKTRVGTVYPWTQLRGSLASTVSARPFAVKDPHAAAKLLCGSDDGYVLDATNIFNAYDAELDADGLPLYPTFSCGLVEPARGSKVTFTDVVLEYHLSPGGVTPTIVGQVASEKTSGGALIFPQLVSLPGAAPVNDATVAPFRFSKPREGRGFQFEFHQAADTRTKMLRVRGWRGRFRQRGRRR